MKKEKIEKEKNSTTIINTVTALHVDHPFYTNLSSWHMYYFSFNLHHNQQNRYHDSFIQLRSLKLR